MSDEEGSPLEQPDSPALDLDLEEPDSPEEQEDLITETNGDHPEESENDDQEEAGSTRKRSLSTSEDKNDESPSIKVSKEEISLAIICDTYSKALKEIKQTETSIVFHLKVKVTEDLSLNKIPVAVENVLTEDPETKCVVILLPQDDLRVESIPQSCKRNSCNGKGLQHTLPIPVTSLAMYMDMLKRTREELINTYPDTDFYWVTPGPIDFRYLNRNKLETEHGHSTTSDYHLWKVIISNYNKRLKVINEEMPGNMTINWFTRSCWQNRDNRGKKSDSSIQRVLEGDLQPIKSLGLIEKGEHLTVKGGQAMWMIVRKKIKWYRKSKAMEEAKAKTEKEEDPSASTDDDHKKGEKVNGKTEEGAHTQNDLNESQKKKLSESTVIKTTIVGDSWIQILSEIERWQPVPTNRMNVKVYPDLTLDSVIEKVDEVLSEVTDTKNLVLSVFQNDISIGLSAEYVEKNECLPCVYYTVEDLMEKASNIDKYIKKTYPQVKVFWVAPGPVGYYSGEYNWEEEKMEDDSNEQEKKDDETEEKEDKSEDEEKEETDEEDEEKEETDEEDEETNEKKTNEKAKAVEQEDEKEEEKEEDPELRKLRRACSRCNTMAMILNKRLHFRFKKQVIDWFEVFKSKLHIKLDWYEINISNNSNISPTYLHKELTTGSGIKPEYEIQILEGKVVEIGNINPECEFQTLEGKVVETGNLDEDLVNLSELGGTRLMNLIITTISGKNPIITTITGKKPIITIVSGEKPVITISGEKPRSRGSNDHGSSGINKRVGGMGGRIDGGRGRGSSPGRGGGGRKDSGMGQRPVDNRLTWDGRGSGQYDPWSQQGGGNWKGQHQRYQSLDMRDIINREHSVNNRRDYWGGSSQYVDPWARNDYSGYYRPRY